MIIKRILFLLMLSTIFQSCKPVINLFEFESSPEHYPLNGHVKFISSRGFTIKDSLGLIVKDKKSTNPDYSCDEDWWFNENGQVIQKQLKVDTIIIYKSNYEYNNQGLLEKYEAFNNGFIISYYDPEDDQILTIKYEYNRTGKIISKMYVDLGGSIEFGKYYKYKYDNHHNLTEKIVLDEKNNIDSITLFKYDDKNRKISKVMYDSNSLITSKDTIIFHKKGTEIIYFMYNKFEIEEYCFRWQIIGDYRIIESFRDGSEIPMRKSTRYRKNKEYFTTNSWSIDDNNVFSLTKEILDNEKNYYQYSTTNKLDIVTYLETKKWIKPNQLIHSRTWFNEQGEAETLEKRVYFFDKKRNWILKHYLDLNGLQVIEERKIVYY